MIENNGKRGEKCSDKKEIEKFLKELNSILQDKNFNIAENLIVIRSHKSQEKERFSTPYTLLALDYDANDIVERLKELTVNEYSETLMDVDDNKPPLLFVFGKSINARQIYIKLKIKGEQSRRILCLSFHYAEKEMKFPYT